MNAGTKDCILDHYLPNTTNNKLTSWEWLFWSFPIMRFTFEEIKNEIQSIK